VVHNLKAEARTRAHEEAVGLRSASNHSLRAPEAAHIGQDLAVVHNPRWAEAVRNHSKVVDRIRWEVVDHSHPGQVRRSHQADARNY